MARKPKAREPSPDPSLSSSDQDENVESPPTEINPYEVLSLEKSATADQIKIAYRKAALRHHPDKVKEEDKAEAHKKFQEIAFAYAILSDEQRRKRYDATGNTSESLDDDADFDWLDFFRSQREEMMTTDAMLKFKTEYQGGEEEKNAILEAYEQHNGNMDMIFDNVMCSNVLDDDERFRRIIDAAIKDGEVRMHKAYCNESESKRKKRFDRAKKEELEAMELAEELGVKEKLFGDEGKKKKGKKNDGEDVLKALMKQRQQGRAENFLDNLEAKYGGKSKGKRTMEEPPEHLFAANRKKSKNWGSTSRLLLGRGKARVMFPELRTFWAQRWN